MSDPRLPVSRSGLSRPAVLAVLILVGTGAGWTYVLLRDGDQVSRPPIGGASLHADSNGVIADDAGTAVSGQGPGPDATAQFVAPPPPFDDIDRIPLGNLFGYIDRMRFDEARGDSASLPMNDRGQTAAVRVLPLAGLRQLDSAAFAQGRIIARIISSGPYADLGLTSDYNYLWVQGGLDSTLAARMISSSVLARPRQPDSFLFSGSPPPGPTDRDVRWVITDSTLTLWIACGPGWCRLDRTPR
ncbi:MAG: hypothetical protein AB7I33_00310 [Gemmatimonadales bacterium]